MTPAPDSQQTILSPELSPRLAAIDIGSNSIRLIVAEALRDRQYRVLDEEKETARLAGKLSSTGKLDPEAVERAMTALRRMKQIADGYQVHELRVIATCAVREATDGEEFRRRAQQDLGVEVEVISSEQEAHLAFCSVSRAFQLEGKDVAVADIGGGSTEIVLASGNIVEAVCATPLGAVRLTEMFADEQGRLDEHYDKMVDWIDRELKRRTKHAILRPHVLIGSGGTFTALADMVAAANGQTGAPRRGRELTRAEVSHLVDRLRKLPPRLRRSVPGLSPDRADIITAGVVIVDRLMQHFRVNRVQVHDRGVRDGLLLTMIDDSLGGPSDNPHDREAAVERFAVECKVDLKHGRQVAKLAGMMLSQLIGTHGLKAEDRPILEAASMLQDVGYLINYEDHHKHSYHLIRNSRLAGFKPSDLELVANVARYHRGSLPKKKHDNFKRLSKPERKRVAKLAGILRIAGGLDRSNSQQVQGVQVTGRNGGLTLRVLAPQNPEVDIWAAERRVELLEEALDVKLAIEWIDPNASRADKPEHRAGAAQGIGAEATNQPDSTPPQNAHQGNNRSQSVEECEDTRNAAVPPARKRREKGLSNDDARNVAAAEPAAARKRAKAR